MGLVKNIYLKVDERQRDTMLAALRHYEKNYWHVTRQYSDLAENDREGDDAALSVEEIDALCMQINVGAEDPWFIVCGRSHGDDDDSACVYQCKTSDEAVAAFKEDMRVGLKAEDYADRDEDDGIHGWTV